MGPLPAAVKLRARVKGVLNPPHSSVPLIKKAYCPFKLALEKVPAGGGGGGPTTAVPPLHAAQREASRTAASGRNLLMEPIFAHHPAAGSSAGPRLERLGAGEGLPPRFPG